MADPVAYFLTFHTYGTYLHGHRGGSVDRDHNRIGSPHLPPNDARESAIYRQLLEPPLHLSMAQRRIVCSTMQEVCRHRHWRLHAVHARVTHVHTVVSAPVSPERALSDLKAWCTRRMRETGHLSGRERVWSRHGSTVYLFTAATVHEKVQYTLHGQGEVVEGTVHPI